MRLDRSFLNPERPRERASEQHIGQSGQRERSYKIINVKNRYHMHTPILLRQPLL